MKETKTYQPDTRFSDLSIRQKIQEVIIALALVATIVLLCFTPDLTI